MGATRSNASHVAAIDSLEVDTFALFGKYSFLSSLGEDPRLLS